MTLERSDLFSKPTLPWKEYAVTTRILVMSILIVAALAGCSKTDRSNAPSADSAGAPVTDQESTAPAETSEPGATDPAAASTPHQQDATGTTSPQAPASAGDSPADASSPHQREATPPDSTQQPDR
jgi:hypothetical protein